MVERDVLEGYVSFEKAKEDYGVVIDPNTLKVNGEATKKFRDEQE
jgi:N-methylhydantoinase B/oxoprolinase/acetone carboxylase alpha subunit